MSVIDHIAFAARLEGLDDDDDASGPILRRGWDFWQPGKPATDGTGNARTPHPAVLGRGAIPDKCLAIVDAGMNLQELHGSIWRQCLIRPGDEHDASPADPFAVSRADAACTRAEHLIALVGHTPRDLAYYLDDLRRRAGALFRLVLAKDFRGAIALHPAILNDPWPEAARRLWRKPANDYLPPFLVAVLYAELARLANNQAGLLELSFDRGAELTTTQFLDRVPLAGRPWAPAAIMRAIEMAPYQSIALTPPDQILETCDRSAAAAWSRTAAGGLALTAGIRGGLDTSPTSPGRAKFIGSGFAAHPGFWRERRKDHGSSRQPRPAATYWGLNWRRHAATGLLELMEAARDWNELYRPGGPRLRSRLISRRRRAQALTVINFSWLAEANPAAALAEIANLEKAKKSACVLPAISQISPLSRDGSLTGKSGDDLLQKAQEELDRRASPGELGYTARYRAHLWLDDHGDDIAHYREFQRSALAEHEAALRGDLPEILMDESRVPREVVELLGRQRGIPPQHGAIGHNRTPALAMTENVMAARAAQNLGMTISTLSTDQILEVLSRKR